MTTLHTLRRHYDLSLGDLAQLTGIPLRRLAEYEYEDRPLPLEDQHALISLFSIQMQSMGSGWDAAAPIVERTVRQPEQAFLLAAFAATVTLSGTWGLGAALRPIVEQVVDTVSAVVTRTNPVQPTPSPTMLPAALVLPAAPLPTATVAVQPTATVQPTSTARPTPQPEPSYPYLCPVVSPHGAVVIMAGYTAGTHEPTNTNGAVDLAIDANDDGMAEPWASRNAEVIATHDGIAIVRLDNWAAGNYIMIQGSEGWRSGYSQLESVDVRSGDQIKTGQRIGTIGATGQAGGPHLEYKVWYNGENTNPTQLLNCD